VKLLLAVLVAAVVLASIPASAAAVQRCGNIPRAAVSLLDVRAKATSCRSARIVTRQWLRNVLARRCTRFACR